MQEIRKGGQTAPCEKELPFVFLIEREKMRLFLNSVKPLTSSQPKPLD